MPEKLKIAVMASGRGSNFRSLALSCRDESFPAAISLLATDNPEAGALDIAAEMGIETAVVDT